MKLTSFISFLVAAVLIAACAQDRSDRLICLSSSVNEDPMSADFNWTTRDSIIVADPAISDNRMSLRSCWNADSLYLRFDVSDTRLQAFITEKDHKQLFRDDMAEFLLDPRMDRDSVWREDDIIYHINILGYKKDDRGTVEGISDPNWDGNARYIVSVDGTICDNTDTDKGYSITVAVPWSEIGLTPAPGTEMGFNLAFMDNEGDDIRRMVKWAESPEMRRPDYFGILKLK